MKYLSQRDPAWAKIKIGKTNLPVGDWGCTLTDVSMFLSFFGCYMSPAELARFPGLFNPEGKIIWGMIEKATKGKVKFEWRAYTRDDKRIKASLDPKSPKTVVLLEVNNGKHWVAAIGAQGGDYRCVDPIDGKARLVLSRYPNITGSAHLRAV